MEKSPINTIVHYWLYDSLFSDAPGVPRVLPLAGEASFTMLVRKYLGDLPVGAVRRELTSRGVMELDDLDQCRLLPRNFFNSADRDDLMEKVLYSVRNLLETVEFNARSFDQKPSGGRLQSNISPRFERNVWTNKLDQKAAAEFRAWLTEHGQAFLEQADKFIGEREIHEPDQVSSKPILGLGLYYYEQDPSSAKGQD
jgi:hypothetical protein